MNILRLGFSCQFSWINAILSCSFFTFASSLFLDHSSSAKKRDGKVVTIGICFYAPVFAKRIACHLNPLLLLINPVLLYMFDPSLDAVNVAGKRKEFGGMEQGDDEAALLNPGSKPLAQIVQDDSFREFEFRQYLFACQSKVRKRIALLMGVFIFFSFFLFLAESEGVVTVVTGNAYWIS